MRSILFGMGLGLAAAGVYAWLIAWLAERTIYYLMNAKGWEAHRTDTCTPLRRRYFFGDLRAGSPDQSRALELSCEQAVAVPASHGWVRNPRGQRLHYLRYGRSGCMDPILLYIPGISANYVAGTRYIPMARRLGFELVILELSNHGASDDDGTGAAYGCREKDDIPAMLAELARTDPGRPILLFATSMSAMAAVNAADELMRFRPQLRALVLESPPSSLREMLAVFARKLALPACVAAHVYWLVEKRSAYRYADYALPLRAGSLQLPTFVVIAEPDILVPVAMAKSVFDALPAGLSHQFKLYPHGDHSAVWNGQPEQFEADLKAFWEAATASKAAIQL